MRAYCSRHLRWRTKFVRTTFAMGAKRSTVVPKFGLCRVLRRCVRAEGKGNTMLWRGFQKPKRLVVDSETPTEKYGKFSAQPFDRGFGTTIGNGLRRTLLSSIEGAAVTAVRIEGVLHEFQSITGVVEDA